METGGLHYEQRYSHKLHNKWTHMSNCDSLIHAHKHLSAMGTTPYLFDTLIIATIMESALLEAIIVVIAEGFAWIWRQYYAILF